MTYISKLIALVIVTAPAALLTTLIGLFDPDGKRVYGISRFWSWMVLKVCGISLTVKGLGQIDYNQRYIFIVNHQSNLDIPVLIQALLPFQLRWLAKKELLWVPLFGWAMWAAKHITVNRSNRSQALQSLKKAKKRIESGISLVFFPEGTRSPDGRLLPFKRGGFWVAVKTQTPLVPITIKGSGALLPKGDWRIRSGEIQLTISKPLSVEDHAPGKLLDLSKQVRAAMANALGPRSSCSRQATNQASSTRAENSSMENE